MSEFTYSVNTNGLRQLPAGEAAALIKRCGYDGVEWGLPAEGELVAVAKEMARAARDQGLAVVGFINAGHLWKPDVIRRYSEAAVAGGGTMLRVAHPWLAWDFNESLHQRDSYMTLFHKTREALELLAVMSREFGVRYVLETHTGSLCACAAACRHLLDGLDPATVGVILDVANGIGEGFLRPRHSAEVLGPYLAYVHAKNCRVEYGPPLADRGVVRQSWSVQAAPFDQGMVDWVEVFFGLKCAGFSGWVSVEDFSKGDPGPILTEALAYLKRSAEAAPSQPEEPFTTFND